MNYFWIVESELPEDVGFGLLSAAHIGMLFVVLAAVIGMTILYYHQQKSRTFMLLVLSFLLPVLETFKIGFLWASGHMSIGYLPIHLCSLSIYLYPLYAVLKQPDTVRLPADDGLRDRISTDIITYQPASAENGKIREIIGEFCCLVLLPAGISAILLPDWTMYPLLSYMSLHSFCWHAIQIVLPLCLLTTGEVSPKIRTIWRSLALLLLLSIPVWIFDRLSGCNYWFLMRPIPGTPLQWLYQTLGQRGYLFGLLLLATGVVFATQGMISAVRRAFAHAA